MDASRLGSSVLSLLISGNRSLRVAAQQRFRAVRQYAVRWTDAPLHLDARGCEGLAIEVHELPASLGE
jgi:hypothetical protein